MAQNTCIAGILAAHARMSSSCCPKCTYCTLYMFGKMAVMRLFLVLVTLWARSSYGEVVKVTGENFSELQEGELMLAL